MNPAELILFMLIGFGALLGIGMGWFLLRKRRKWAWIMTGVIVVAYIGALLFYPTYREVTHAAYYEQLLVYLEKTYPEQQFIIEPEVYEQGYQIGQFSVHRTDTPLVGVMLAVKKDGGVAQTSTWTKSDYPTRENVWQTISTDASSYTLDKKLPQVEKKDRWVDGEWMVFAVTIDERPALAFYRYEQGGYSSWPVVEAAPGEVVSSEWQHRLFVYIDEGYVDEKAVVEWQGEQVTLNIAEHKGKLIVLE